jgi:membrane-associated phospholipid phosphatase
VAPRWIAASTLAISLSLAAPVAEAEDEDPLAWHAEWSRFGAGDWIFSGALAGVLAATTLAFDKPSTHVQGGVLFDDALRDALRIKSEAGRLSAEHVSDLFQATLIVYPLVIDSLLLTWVARGRPDTAYQMLAIGGESFLLSTAITALTKDLSGRARPYTRSCGNDTCGSSARNKSFFSGHAATAFTGAGLVCANHEMLPLYEGPGSDAAVCAGALVMASAVGILRIASDDHYATDVLVGTAVGLLSGYLFPRLVYYRTGVRVGIGPISDAGAIGLRLTITDPDHSP